MYENFIRTSFSRILGAFYTAVRTGFSQNLHAIFCLAENSVSERSTRPDDIHILYSGKSVEINNTVSRSYKINSSNFFILTDLTIRAIYLLSEKFSDSIRKLQY